MKVAMIGAGRIGKVHAASIKADGRARLSLVSDVVEDAARALADEHGAQIATPEQIMSDPSIGAVLIASSTDTHAGFISAGVTAGKAVFCEKPIDLSLDRAVRIRDEVAAHPRPVMIGLNRRFDPNFAALKQKLSDGEAGRPEMLSVTSFDPAPPPVSYVEVSGGLFRDMMIHDFDMCAFLFGLPETVMAHGSCLVDPQIGAAGDVDTAVVVLSYADGRLATIRNSRRAAYGYDQRVEVLGSRGALSVGNVVENTLRIATSAGVVSAKPEHFFLERYARAYQREWVAFVDACLTGAPVPVTVQDGVNALALAEAAVRSLREGRPVPIGADVVGG